MDKNIYESIVIGTGPAGYTAAIYLARANLKPLVIEGLQPGGQLTTTTEVENFPGFPDGIQGPELMSNMRQQAARFGTEFLSGWVEAIDLTKRPFTLKVAQLGEIKTETVIIATGASTKYLNIPGEQENIGNGVSACATCDGFFFRNKKVIVVGGGDTALQEAEVLARFTKEVTVVHRRDELRASKVMQQRAKSNEKINWYLNYTPLQVVSTNMGIMGLKVKNNGTGEEQTLKTEGVFIAIGHEPNTRFLQGHLDLDQQGYIVVKPGSSETSVPGVFAAGDVHDAKYRQAITAAAAGCQAALDCEKFLYHK